MPATQRWNRAFVALWSRRWNGSAIFANKAQETSGMKVGVIGLGSMGMGAALNLHRKGHAVTGCEVREAARAEFEAAQGRTVGSADQLPADLEAVVVFVINAAQTEEVLFGSAGCLSRL